MTTTVPISRDLTVYSAISIALVNQEDDEKVFIQEGTQITVEGIYKPKIADTRIFIGTCIARPEESKDDVLPSIFSRCRFNIDLVRFDVPISLPIGANALERWGPSKIACTVTRISDL